MSLHPRFHDPLPARAKPCPGGACREVQVRFPARLEHVRLIRLVASSLATQASFSVDETEDVRIAVDELCSTLIDRSIADGEMVVTFEIEGTTIRMCATARSSDEHVMLDELAEHVLRATVDAHSIGLEDGIVVVRLEKACASDGS